MEGGRLDEAARQIKPDLRILYGPGFAEEVLELENDGKLVPETFLRYLARGKAAR
jgi:hypothetical protein